MKVFECQLNATYACYCFVDANKVHLEARIGVLEEERDSLLASVDASHEQLELLQRTVRSRELTVRTQYVCSSSRTAHALV